MVNRNLHKSRRTNLDLWPASAAINKSNNFSKIAFDLLQLFLKPWLKMGASFDIWHWGSLYHGTKLDRKHDLFEWVVPVRARDTLKDLKTPGPGVIRAADMDIKVSKYQQLIERSQSSRQQSIHHQAHARRFSFNQEGKRFKRAR